MPLGTIQWLPHRSVKRGKPFILTAAKLRIIILATAAFLASISALSFYVGLKNGREQVTTDIDTDMLLFHGELYQLSRRVNSIRNDLEEISNREEQILVAGSGLNLDFSSLLPQGNATIEPPGSDIFRYINELEMEILLVERLAAAELMAYDSLANYFLKKEEELSSLPTIWPVDGIFVSDFGPRVDPFTGAVRYHKGIDIACVNGTPVYAPANGVVVFTGWTGGWGLNVVVKHTDHISTRYAHCSSTCSVAGQEVMRGDLIARVGSTGRSVAPHLHYEVLIDGVQVDPEDYIIREGPGAAIF